MAKIRTEAMFLQVMKSCLRFSCPLELYVFACKVVQRGCMLRTILNKTSVVGAKAYKCFHLSWVLRGWPSSDLISVSRVWLQAMARHQMAEEHYMVLGQMTLAA